MNDALDNQTLFDNACQMIRAGNRVEAIPLLEKVIAAEPTDALALRVLAEALGGERRHNEAIPLMRQALAITPNDGGMWGQLGMFYGWTGQWNKSRECYDKSLHFAPDLPDTHWNRALHRLMVGDYAEGWKEYLWGKVNHSKRVRTLAPEWEGQTAPKKLFVWTEQGFGDTLMFLRMLKPLREQFPNTEILLEVQRDLIPLLAVQTFLEGVELQELQIHNGMPIGCDAHVGLLTLPSVFGLTLSDLPIETRYLVAPNPDTCARPAGEGLRVGICWKGSAGHGNAWQRDIPKDDLYSLSAVDGVKWACLQKDDFLITGFDAHCPSLNSWADTANVIDSLDLVITADTAVAHLAGAMGKEVWILLPFVSDWRWLLDRADSPWYPTARLYRQTVRGEWGDVIEAVKTSLMQKAQPVAMIDVWETIKRRGGAMSFAATISYEGIKSENPVHWQARLQEAPE
jgi:hypothetical protein